jgi:hypothetical protein
MDVITLPQGALDGNLGENDAYSGQSSMIELEERIEEK